MFFRRWGGGGHSKPGKREYSLIFDFDLSDSYFPHQEEEDNVRFLINGVEYKVSPKDKYTPESKLVDFIRDEAGLKGTKAMCREGGCGACTVIVRRTDPKTGDSIAKAVNSCLIPVFRCNGWDISTIESLGNIKEGYHPIQRRMVKFGASQCGFCSPGMIMSMHSLLESKTDINTREVENNLDGNICRCTGYRPILDAFTSFAVDAPPELLQQSQDIEDCFSYPCPIINATRARENSPGFPLTSTDFQLETASGQTWIKVTTLSQALARLNIFRASGKNYRIVAGSTVSAIFPVEPTILYLDISNVAELTKYSMSVDGITLGSCLTIASIIEIFEKISDMDDYNYTKKMGQHLMNIANNGVRNVGTIGGSLMLKHMHRNSSPDLFVLMEAIGAKIIISAPSNSKPLTLTEFLNVDMYGKIIISIHMPKISEDYLFNSFKVARRHQNSHAIVNAGFLFKVASDQNFKVTEKPRLVFGGISTDFVHASGTETFLEGKELNNESTLKGVFEALDLEVRPNNEPGGASQHYRRTLTKSLLYKAILEIVGDAVREEIRSATTKIVPKICRGMQSFEKDVDKSDLYKAIPKLESPFQASGEAEYINDMPILPNELFGAFVLTTVANAELDSIDTSNALALDGVVRFVEAKDIPGKNNYMVSAFLPVTRGEPIFVADKVESAGQPIGLILATSRDAAFTGAANVKVSYKNVQKPIVNILDAVKKVESEGALGQHTLAIFTSKKTSDKVPTHTIKGEFQNGSQYHFHMETQTCICIPKEDSIDVYSATQWMNHTQWMIAEALNVPNNYVNMYVKRCGGGFGGKLTRATHVGTACAVAAYVTNRPVRVVLDLQTNMNMMGKRSPYWTRYEVKIDEIGKILELQSNIICDMGFSVNEADSVFGALFYQNVYASDGWEVKPGYVTTNTPANTFCRAPGTLNNIAMIEYIMEHISFVLKKDPLEVRAANFRKQGDPSLITGEPLKGENHIVKLLDEIKISAEYEQRKEAVEKFNKENRWKKRGLAASTSTYHAYFHHATFPAYVAIYYADASVVVTHGGVEIGQGINTKVAQTVAQAFDIPVGKIKVKSSNNLTGNNAASTGASITSELCCYAAKRASEIILERMKPIKEKLSETDSWEKLIAECWKAKIDLSATHMYGDNDNIKEYNTWAVIINEVEVDILTGEFKVLRVDLLEDVGKSLNPLIDIGQIEGAYLMGQGLWTTEKIIHSEETGQLLTNRCWTYKPPESKDLPEDFRITLLHNTSNPLGVLGTKAVAEPPICTSVSVLFALKNAIASARNDAGNYEWFQLDGPVTPEDVIKHSMTSSSDFLL